ncbi:MAG: sialidase family protein [Bacteroidota bacterium]
MKISTVRAVVTFCLSALLLISLNSYAQPATKDVNVQHDPMVKAPGFKAPQGDATQASIITIGDYDNFKLGVDFAECSITSNPLNPLEMYAVWNDLGSGGGKGYRTSNGYDWVSSNPTWTGMSGDVVVVSDSTGRLIYENMYGSSIQGCKVVTSTDFGQTWDPVVIAINGVDKNWIAADQTGGMYSNYIYATMTASSGGNHARSINNGTSFSNTQNFNTQSIPGMMVAVGPKDALQGGAIYVVTNSGSSFSSTYTFYESLDGGLSYTFKSAQSFSNYVGSNSNGRNSVQNMRTRPYPFMAVDNSYGPHRGRLYLVYASNYPAGDGNKPDIFCRYSDNEGANWSTAKTVNDDQNTQNNNNWFPAIWNDKKTGRLFISWMDTRDCPTSDSAMIYGSYTDDGVTFAENQKVSNKKMKINCTNCGGGGSPAYYGDYNGVTSNGTTAMMAWTDFRENTFGSYVGYSLTMD